MDNPPKPGSSLVSALLTPPAAPVAEKKFVPPVPGEVITSFRVQNTYTIDRTQIPFAELCNHHALFPIALESLNPSILQNNSRLRVERQGLNREFVFLEESPTRRRASS